MRTNEQLMLINNFTGIQEVGDNINNRIDEIHGMEQSPDRSLGRLKGKLLATTGRLDGPVWGLYHLRFRDLVLMVSKEGGTLYAGKEVGGYPGQVFPYPNYESVSDEYALTSPMWNADWPSGLYAGDISEMASRQGDATVRRVIPSSYQTLYDYEGYARLRADPSGLTFDNSEGASGWNNWQSSIVTTQIFGYWMQGFCYIRVSWDKAWLKVAHTFPSFTVSNGGVVTKFWSELDQLDLLFQIDEDNLPSGAETATVVLEAIDINSGQVLSYLTYSETGGIGTNQQKAIADIVEVNVIPIINRFELSSFGGYLTEHPDLAQPAYLRVIAPESDYVPATDTTLSITVVNENGYPMANPVIGGPTGIPITHIDMTNWYGGQKTVSFNWTGTAESGVYLRVYDSALDRYGLIGPLNINPTEYQLQLQQPNNGNGVFRGPAFNHTIQARWHFEGTAMWQPGDPGMFVGNGDDDWENHTFYVPSTSIALTTETPDVLTVTSVSKTGWVGGSKTVIGQRITGGSGYTFRLMSASDNSDGRFRGDVLLEIYQNYKVSWTGTMGYGFTSPLIMSGNWNTWLNTSPTGAQALLSYIVYPPGSWTFALIWGPPIVWRWILNPGIGQGASPAEAEGDYNRTSGGGPVTVTVEAIKD